jgi:ribosomal protein S27E
MKTTTQIPVLRERYPLIFVEDSDISVGDGWFNLLDAACGCIQSHIDWCHKNYESAIEYNAMRDALRAGDDTLFLKFYETMPLDWVQRQRDHVLTNAAREVIVPCQQVVATQVKEKFGTLRFYAQGGNECTHGMIQMAEAMSAVTCEMCGAPGTTGGKGWIRTLCARHHMEKA